MKKGNHSVICVFNNDATVSVRYSVYIPHKHLWYVNETVQHLLLKAAATMYSSQTNLSFSDFLKEFEVIKEYLNLSASILSIFADSSALSLESKTL